MNTIAFIAGEGGRVHSWISSAASASCTIGASSTECAAGEMLLVMDFVARALVFDAYTTEPPGELDGQKVSDRTARVHLLDAVRKVLDGRDPSSAERAPKPISIHRWIDGNAVENVYHRFTP